ncbi:hypothetical protein Saro_2589 [Novosphingobium aromaticivorans DSM 12444]|uniref:Uncharacterized protein n=1 Tax=Novosphingobium aromaticivorans (strain ATCC 700278 / DSM 12444 / CCUG 56034 / CIP 105152 / NBRC 16084 / F199) TaxID=279238 RepID=Q2G548_NOVAD|nr:hypothetical protein [Novosphingobium aromaticivorans]ABD27025.1 hypothetical protein Saro_2589 [Novosphingobium aromaticivorans DSM 12444]SCY48291.1 hypothetical protein SAMN05660666_01845 [Novosphingobium aromaticivorans]
MPNPEITFPGRYTPVNAVAFASANGATEIVTPSAPLPVAIAPSIASLEPAGAAVTGTTMPTGGQGLTGWLSAIYRACISALPTGSNHIGNVFVDDVSDNLTVAGTATSATTVVSSPTTGFGGGTFQVTSAGTGCTLTYEQSNDGTTWVAMPVMAVTAATSAPVLTTNTAGLFAFTCASAFVRVRVSTYGSGTVGVSLVLKRRPLTIMGTSLAGGSAALGSVSVTGSVNGNIGYTDSTSVMAASAAFNGTGRFLSSTHHTFFAATAFSDVAGTLFIDQTLDTGSTWQQVASTAVSASTAATLSVRTMGNYANATQYRVRYANGPTAQTLFRLSSVLAAS